MASVVPRLAIAPRDPAQPHRAATPLELLTDLCYVVAIAQAAVQLEHKIAEDHVGQGLLYFALSFFAVWWAWLTFAWHSSAYDSDDPLHRVLTLLQIVGSLILAAGVPDMFHHDYRLAIAGYVVMRLGLVLMWARAGAGHPERRATARRYVVGLVAVQAAWVVAVVLTGQDFPLWLFLVLGALDFAVPAWAEQAGQTPWHPHHIAERYGLFFIIVLGETILSTTLALQAAFAEEHPPAELYLVVVGGLLVVFGVWWLYFAREDADVLTGNDVGFQWGFGHYLIFGSAAAVGAGFAARIAFYTDHAEVTDTVSGAFVTGPVAVLLAALWLIMVRLHDASWRTAGPFAVAIAALVAVTFVPWSELWAGLIVVALLVVELRLTDQEPVGVDA